MFISHDRVLMNQAEARSFVEYLIKAMWWIDTQSYVRSLTLALHQILIFDQPIFREQFEWVNQIGHRAGSIPPELKMKRGLYYRARYDSKFSDDEKRKARRVWKTKVIDPAANVMEMEWSDPMRMIDKMRGAGVHPERIADLTTYMRQNNPYLLPDVPVENLGDLQLISA